jgi:glycosyltransferase involved in cell wall biosynthesis
MPELLASRYDGRPPAALDALLRWLERRTQRAADHTVTVNDEMRRRLGEAGADRISMVRNGPVQARAERAVPDEALRRGHRHLVCWAGKMGPQDRVDLTLRVADEVVHRMGRTDCGFVILGDGECLDDLRRMSADLGLEQWMHFTDWVPERDAFAHFVSADLGIDTSLQAEVSPVKVMEYMGCGLPVVSFDLPETRSVTEGAGVLVPAGDEVALAKALVDLLDDPQRRAELGRVGRDRVRDWLSWERQSPTYLRAVGPSDRSTAPATRHGQP